MKRILIRGPNWLGDHLMALPALAGLRELYRASHITFQSRIPADEIGIRFWDECISLDRQNRPSPFDIGITFPASVSSAWGLFRMKIPVRVGFAEGVARVFLTDSIDFPGRRSQRHKSDLYGDLVRWLGGAPISLPVKSTGARGKTIAIAPGASIRLREWPYFIELIVGLARRWRDYPIVLIGDDAQKAWASRCERLGLPVLSRIGDTRLTEVMAILGDASLCIANDSGIAHLASLVGCPTVILYGPGDPKYVKPIFGGTVGLRVQSLPCSPCERARCASQYGYQQCLRQLSADTVLDACERLLALSV